MHARAGACSPWRRSTIAAHVRTRPGPAWSAGRPCGTLVLAFNRDGPAGLIDRRAPGHPPKLSQAQRQALVEIVASGPDPDRHGVVRWRRKDLAAWIDATYAISLDETTVGRELKRLGFAKLSARPRHYAQDPAALETF